MPQKPVRDGDQRGERLSTDQIMTVLGRPQRRAILRYLRDSPDQRHTLDELVGHLDSLERPRSPAPGRDRIRSTFVHVHGPKLEAAGLVDFDAPARELRYCPNERVEALLDCVDDWLEER